LLSQYKFLDQSLVGCLLVGIKVDCQDFEKGYLWKVLTNDEVKWSVVEYDVVVVWGGAMIETWVLHLPKSNIG